MKITFGKYIGKAMEMLVLKVPEYVAWMLEQHAAPSSQMAKAQDEAKRLIIKFDDKPFMKKCSGKNCNETATRCTVYDANVLNPYWWCENCNPYQSGAAPGKLQVLTTYCQAISHVENYYGNRKSDYQSIIRSMAEAKGLPRRVGDAQSTKFFL